MYVDDMTLNRIADDVDIAVATTNRALVLIIECCIVNAMTLRPINCKAMLLYRSVFIGPIQVLTINNIIVNTISCLGVVIDSKLRRGGGGRERGEEKAFAGKLNLLKSLTFLPTTCLEQFYFKVVIPSISYGILFWGNCNKTLFEDLNKMHVRAATIILSVTGKLQGTMFSVTPTGTHYLGIANINLPR